MSATNTATAVKPKRSVADVFVEGAVQGWNIGVKSTIPNVVMAYAVIAVLKLTGALDFISMVFDPIMGLFSLPGVAIAVLVGAWLSMGGGVAPHYLMIVDRENNMDVLTVMVEVDERYFSDEIRKLDELKNKVAAVLKQALGVSVRVKLVEPRTIQRSEGKAKRVIDNRQM